MAKKRRANKPLGTQSRVLRREETSLGQEARHIVECARACDARVVTLGQLVFFSTDSGDAWMLDPEDKFALRLAQEGSPVAYHIVETATSFAIEWNADYEITDAGFVVGSRDGRVSVFSGYPVEQLRAAERQTRGQHDNATFRGDKGTTH